MRLGVAVPETAIIVVAPPRALCVRHEARATSDGDGDGAAAAAAAAATAETAEGASTAPVPVPKAAPESATTVASASSAFYQTDGEHARLVFSLGGDGGAKHDAAEGGPTARRGGGGAAAAEAAQTQVLFVVDVSRSMGSAILNVREAAAAMGGLAEFGTEPTYVLYNSTAKLASAAEVRSIPVLAFLSLWGRAMPYVVASACHKSSRAVQVVTFVRGRACGLPCSQVAEARANGMTSFAAAFDQIREWVGRTPQGADCKRTQLKPASGQNAQSFGRSRRPMFHAS